MSPNALLAPVSIPHSVWPSSNKIGSNGVLDMLRDLDCFKEVLLADVAVDPKTGRRYQIISTKIDFKMKFDAMGSL